MGRSKGTSEDDFILKKSTEGTLVYNRHQINELTSFIHGEVYDFISRFTDLFVADVSLLCACGY